MVGATGFEPVTPSVSAKPREPLCSEPFSQVGSDRSAEGKRSLYRITSTRRDHYITPLSCGYAADRSVEDASTSVVPPGSRSTSPNGTPLSRLSQQTRAARASTRPRQPGPSRHRSAVAAANRLFAAKDEGGVTAAACGPGWPSAGPPAGSWRAQHRRRQALPTGGCGAHRRRRAADATLLS
jgi:hypothetical protein